MSIPSSEGLPGIVEVSDSFSQVRQKTGDLLCPPVRVLGRLRVIFVRPERQFIVVEKEIFVVNL